MPKNPKFIEHLKLNEISIHNQLTLYKTSNDPMVKESAHLALARILTNLNGTVIGNLACMKYHNSGDLYFEQEKFRILVFCDFWRKIKAYHFYFYFACLQRPNS